MSAPEALRAELRGMTSDNQITYCASLRPRSSRDLEHRTTVRVLCSTALRILVLRQEANDLEAEIEPLVAAMQPQLLALTGVRPISAAQVLISWSHPGRFRSEAAFAAFAGASPIPASSGLTIRRRLNRGGDRQLNRALHTIVLARARHGHTGLHRPPNHRRQKSPRSQAMPETRYRTAAALPAPSDTPVTHSPSMTLLDET